MASVRFDVHHEFGSDPRTVWDELVDWEGHAAWIPATHMEVEPGDPTAAGARFTAFTGVGPIQLEDRMRVVRATWSEVTSTGECEVEKLGPVLHGRAGFTVAPSGAGSAVDWVEDVTVPHVPRFIAPVLARLGAVGFRLGMRRLDALLGRRAAETGD